MTSRQFLAVSVFSLLFTFGFYSQAAVELGRHFPVDHSNSRLSFTWPAHDPLFDTVMFSENTEPQVEASPDLTSTFPQSSIGVQLGGGGIVGLTYSKDLSEDRGLNVSINYRPTIVMSLEGAESSDGIMIPVELIFWRNQDEGGSKGPKRNGFGVIGGVSLSKYPEVMVAGAYEHERYKNRNHIFNASIGAGLIFVSNLPDDAEQVTPFLIYWRFAWRWER